MNLKATLSRISDVVRRKHFSWKTEQSYRAWTVRYSRFVKTLPPNLTSEQKLERFVTALAKQNVAASTQNQAFKGLRARREATIRFAPSKEQVALILKSVRDVHGYPTRLIVHLLYGCGLRVSEPLNLRIKDVDLADSRLIIRGGKGGKDRVVSLPCCLVPAIKRQIKFARAMWERDSINALPVPLPGRLDKKYPQSRFSWQWYWLFPASKPCQHPRTGEVVRWRCHEANVQRCVKEAAKQHGLEGLVTPHCLRHSYATHAMQNGAYVRDVQSALGHVCIETTLTYLHTDAMRVTSPLMEIAA